jgi:hypothetical protein
MKSLCICGSADHDLWLLHGDHVDDVKEIIRSSRIDSSYINFYYCCKIDQPFFNESYGDFGMQLTLHSAHPLALTNWSELIPNFHSSTSSSMSTISSPSNTSSSSSSSSLPKVGCY